MREELGEIVFFLGFLTAESCMHRSLRFSVLTQVRMQESTMSYKATVSQSTVTQVLQLQHEQALYTGP
jgi:hypothetical protein